MFHWTSVQCITLNFMNHTFNWNRVSLVTFCVLIIYFKKFINYKYAIEEPMYTSEDKLVMIIYSKVSFNHVKYLGYRSMHWSNFNDQVFNVFANNFHNYFISQCKVCNFLILLIIYGNFKIFNVLFKYTLMKWKQCQKWKEIN